MQLDSNYRRCFKIRCRCQATTATDGTKQFYCKRFSLTDAILFEHLVERSDRSIAHFIRRRLSKTNALRSRLITLRSVAGQYSVTPPSLNPDQSGLGSCGGGWLNDMLPKKPVFSKSMAYADTDAGFIWNSMHGIRKKEGLFQIRL